MPARLERHPEVEKIQLPSGPGTRFRFSFNDYVEVQLTDIGIQHLKKTSPYKFSKVDAEGWTKMQFHDLLSTFRSLTTESTLMPFGMLAFVEVVPLLTRAESDAISSEIAQETERIERSFGR